MKFSIGDRIVLLRTGEEGTVTGFIGKDMLEVEVNGISFPVYADEVDHPYLKWFTDKSKPKKQTPLPEQIRAEPEKQRLKRLSRGIYLSFMPVYREQELEDIVDSLKIHLINETAASIRFSYDVRVLHRSEFRLEGSLHAFGNLFLHTIDYGLMTDQPRFHWRLADAVHNELKPEEGVLRIKPSRLFEQVNQLLLKNEPTFSYLLLEDFVALPKPDPAQLLLPVQRAPGSRKPVRMTAMSDLPRDEVDLHIEQLMPSAKGLSNAAIMEIQLSHLRRYLDLALLHHQERMIIIHGVGTGVLRDAVHQLLKSMPEVKRYRNDYMAKYGFGATEVVFTK